MTPLCFPLPTLPDLLALHAHYPADFPYLLQSSGEHGYDILFAYPREIRCYHDGEGARLLADLQALPCAPLDAIPTLPFYGGWFVYLGYEVAHYFEPSVPAPLPDAFPLAWLARVSAAIIVDRAAQLAYIVAEEVATLAQIQAQLATCADYNPQPVRLNTLQEDAPMHYTDAVACIKDYIRAGDVFQVNISRGWHAELANTVRAVDVYAALRRTNPAPFSALVNFGETQIISSSPERLVRVRDGWVDTRPIAGTHPRSSDPQEDAALKKRLIGDLKERAEHVMLIDLARNDLGRLCIPGTVEVNELMAVTSYAYVHHIESNICGRLRPDCTPFDVVRALFPGGTITGCPKVRTLQIIRELEDTPRRAYTGSLGYINRDGTMDLNILIRTFMQHEAQLRFRAGGGIVADSQPMRELQETVHKARGLLRALGVTPS